MQCPLLHTMLTCPTSGCTDPWPLMDSPLSLKEQKLTESQDEWTESQVNRLGFLEDDPLNLLRRARHRDRDESSFHHQNDVKMTRNHWKLRIRVNRIAIHAQNDLKLIGNPIIRIL